MSERFRPHGQYRVRREGQLVLTDVTGPWNRELVELWALAAHPYAEAAGRDGPYVGIAIIRESMLCPPDALVALADAIRYTAIHQNCIAQLIVAGREVEGRDLVEPAYAPLYAGVMASGFFYDLADALTEARALLARRGAPP